MKFPGAVLATLAACAAQAKKPSFMSTSKNGAFSKIPSLAENDRQSRAKLTQKIQAMARPVPHSKHQRALEDGNNDDANYGGQYKGFWNEEMVVEEFGFDIDSYSLRYTGCHAVSGWDEDVAENENFDTVLGTEAFVTFRLCPRDSCQGESGYHYGCSSNYGEYMLLLDQYVEAMLQYREEKKVTFCKYCEFCGAMNGYKVWNYMMQGSAQTIAAAADEQFQTWYEDYKYQYYQQYGNYGNGNDANGDGEVDQFLIDAKIAYMKLAQQQDYNGNGNGDDDANGNNNNGQAYMNMQQYIGNFQQYWNYQYDASYDDDAYQAEQTWINVNAQYATFCGKAVMNGYFTQDGDFVEDYGYFNCYGNWVSFVAYPQPFVWDECCMGDVPHGWEYVVGVDPDDFQQCDNQYSSQCAATYSECQFALYYDEMEEKYQELMAKQDNGYDVGNELAEFEAVYAIEASERKYSNALTCQQVNYQPEEMDMDMEQNQYNNQQNYEQLYQQKQYYAQAAQDCGDDDECVAAVQEAAAMNEQYQLWIIQSAWQKYLQTKLMNQQFFVGASCASDGWEIDLQIFADEKCAVENPNVSVEDVFGEELSLTYNLVSGECIPCDGEQFKIEMQNQDNDDQQQGDDESAAGGVLPFCSMLYQLAAKCNIYLDPDVVYNAEGFFQDGYYYSPSYSLMYGSEQQQENEKKICAFIESLNSGTYNEDGSIYLGSLGWLSPNKWRNEISAASVGMSSGLKSLIFILAICAAAMGLWAMVLHGALRRKTEHWQPKDPVDMSRQESGIVMGRSRSGPANSPLI